MKLLNFTNMFIYFLIWGFLWFFLGYYLWKFDKEDKVTFDYMQSELSDPKANTPPVGYWRPHQQILEILEKNDPYEVTRAHINMALGKSKYHSYERQLWLWWYVNRREEKTNYGRVHFYTITKKGKKALITHKF